MNPRDPPSAFFLAKLSPPNLLIWGPVRNSPVVSPVEPPQKHAGIADSGRATKHRYAASYGELTPKRLKGLKQLYRIAGRILDENLLAAVAGDDIVAKAPA